MGIQCWFNAPGGKDTSEECLLRFVHYKILQLKRAGYRILWSWLACNGFLCRLRAKEEEFFFSEENILTKFKVWLSGSLTFPPHYQPLHFLWIVCLSILQWAEQEPYSSGGGSDLPGSVQPGGPQTAKKQHQQTDRWGLLGPGQDESPVSKTTKQCL